MLIKKKILVNCFIIKNPKGKSISIDKLYEYFGKNISKYTQYQVAFSSSYFYLCCVDADIDVITICKENNYVCYALYPQLIDIRTYTSFYKITHGYFTKDVFVLTRVY